MYNFEFDNHILFEYEMLVSAASLCACLFWIAFRKFPIKIVFFVLCLTILSIGAFRSSEYNSDTENYASYFYFYSLERDFSLFGLSKLEPLHVFLMQISSEFRVWLILESVACSFALLLLFLRSKTTFPFLLTSAFLLTLDTSSMRFALAIVIFASMLANDRRDTFRLIWITAIASTAHSIMLVSGAFASRRAIVPMAFAGAFVAASTYYSAIGERAGTDLGEVRSIGLKSVTILLSILIFLKFRSREYTTKFLALDLIGFLLIFGITALEFPFLNRIIILGAISVSFSQQYSILKDSSILNRLFYCSMVLAVILPHILITPSLFYGGTW